MTGPMVGWVAAGAAASWLVIWIGARLGLWLLRRGKAPLPPPGARFRELRARDGASVTALHFPAPDNAPTVVHLHGMGVTLRQVVPVGEALARRGLGVVLVEYRGFGESPGRPTEEGLYEDALAVLEALSSEERSPDEIVLLGVSLGSGVAIEMAARGLGSRLILVTPFTSAWGVFRRLLPFIPPSWIARGRFDNAAKADRIGIPTLVIHGDRDWVVPHRMGRALAEAIRGARLVTVPRGGHTDLFDRRNGAVLDAIVEHAVG
jgi:pimeloyl-ACP methyl ester carboxylesterase